MTLDIRGSLKGTKLSRNPYVVFEELISNAIDSFLIRKNSDSTATDLRVDIAVEFFSEGLIDGPEDISVSCRDNGCGLGPEQLKAFLTKDTSYKDDLPIPGIGKCLGAGRIQFFHHFSSLAINSTYRNGEELIKLVMEYAEPKKQIEMEDFIASSGAKTILALISRFKYLRNLFVNACCTDLLLVVFLPRHHLSGKCS